MTTRIDVGDGRIIDPGALDAPAVHKPITRPPVKYHKPKKKIGRPPKPKPPRSKHHRTGPGIIKDRRENIPGYTDWEKLRIHQMVQFRNKLGFPNWSRVGVPDGMNKKTAALAWARAKRKAMKDMENLEKAGLITDEDDQHAREAMFETLKIMRAPVNMDLRLKAAAQVLAYTKSKPVQKTETKIDAAEAWLARIAQADASED